MFVEHLWELTLSQSEDQTEQPSHTKFRVFTGDITSCLETYKADFEPHRLRLGQALNKSARRSPKRRSISEETDLPRFVFCLPLVLPTPRSYSDYFSWSSQLSKRRRLSSSVDSNPEEGTTISTSYLNGRDTPSPSNTTVSLAPSEPHVVTVAMLRALTRDMKKRYSGLGWILYYFVR